MKSESVTPQMKAIEQYFIVVLFITLHKMVLPFESVDKILVYHIHENYLVLLSGDQASRSGSDV